MGGNHELPNASWKKCRDITTIFERHFLRDMHRATRAQWNLYGKRRPSTRPRTLEVRLDDNTRSVQVPIDEYPYAIYMPILDAPGILRGRDPRLEKFPELTMDRIWQWRSPDMEARAKALLKNTPLKTLQRRSTFT